MTTTITRVIAVLSLLVLTACGPAHAEVAAIPTSTPSVTRPSPTPRPTPVHVPFLAPAEVPNPGWFMNWAVVDLATGEEFGSANWRETTWPMSMIKAWIAADYLRTTYPNGPGPNGDGAPASLLRAFSDMIQVSENWPADTYWHAMGGQATTARLIERCGVEDVLSRPWAWSLTELSARDTAHLGQCIADGRAAGLWTGWLLNEMRQVHGQGDFGARQAFPELHDTIAAKNGWWPWEGVWAVACLAIGDGWVLATMQRAPSFPAAARECEDVAKSLRAAALAL